MSIEYQLRKRRTKKDGTVTYYAEFLGDEQDATGRRKRLAMRSTHTSRMSDAKRIAQAMIDDGTITDSRDDVKQFLTTFWTPNESTYLRERSARTGRELSTAYCKHNRVWLVKYFYPYCHDHGMIRLSDLKPLKLTNWILWLHENRKDFGISGTTINKIRQTVSVATAWAKRKHLLAHDPMIEVDRVADEPKPRKAFEPREVVALFNEEWHDPRTKTACVLAATTGMRLGEVRGLKESGLHLPDGYLVVQTNWVDGEGLKPPKSKDKARVNPLRANVTAALGELLLDNPYPSGDRFVFWGETPDEPLSAFAIGQDLKTAMRAVGVAGKSFHSFRHFANSLMLPSLGAEMTREVIGHTSASVNEGYTHLLAPVHDMVRKAFDGVFADQ